MKIGARLISSSVQNDDYYSPDLTKEKNTELLRIRRENGSMTFTCKSIANLTKGRKEYRIDIPIEDDDVPEGMERHFGAPFASIVKKRITFVLDGIVINLDTEVENTESGKKLGDFIEFAYGDPSEETAHSAIKRLGLGLDRSISLPYSKM